MGYWIGVLFAVWLTLMPQAFAGESPAQTATQLTTRLVQDWDPKRTAKDWSAWADKEIVPHMDFQGMTQLAAGRFWKQLTPAQRTDLAEAFQKNIVRTYVRALVGKDRPTIKVLPVRQTTDGEAWISAVVTPTEAPPFDVAFQLEDAHGVWRVRDIKVEGVSLVTAYRSSFAEYLRNGRYDGLLQTLRGKV